MIDLTNPDIMGPAPRYAGGSDGLSLLEMMERYGTPCMSVALIDGFKLGDAVCFGHDDELQFDKSTVFQAASISKPVTAVAVLAAAERGLIGLDLPVNTQLARWKIPGIGDLVTPRMLLSHVSGLGDNYICTGYDPAGTVPTVTEVLDGKAPATNTPARVVRAPGQEYHYSNLGYVILGRLLTDVMGNTFELLMKELVLGPCGMGDSTFGPPPVPDEMVARGYDRNGRCFATRWQYYPEQAAAGLWTTPTDLCRFAAEIQNVVAGKRSGVLSLVSARQMFMPYGVGDFSCGFRIVKHGMGWYASHRGSTQGYRCSLRLHTSKGYGMAVMCNGDNSEKVNDEVLFRIQRACDWDCNWRSVDAIPVGADIRAPHTGVEPS